MISPNSSGFVVIFYESLLIKIEAHGKGHAQVCRQFGLHSAEWSQRKQSIMIWSLHTHNIENGKCDKNFKL